MTTACVPFAGGLFLLVVCKVAYVSSNEFSTLTEDYWSWRLRDSPELASRVNVNDYNNLTERYDIDVLDERKAKVDEYLQALKDINRSSLSHVERSSYDVLYDTLLTYAAGYKWRFYGPMNPINFLEGIQNDPGTFIPSTFDSYKDFDDYAERIAGWAEEALNMIQRMNKSIEMNITNHIVSVEAVSSQIDRFLGDSITDCDLYQPFDEILDNTTLTDNEKNVLRNKANSSLTELREAYLQVKAFVEEVYLNHTRTEFGVSSFKDGKEYYKACLKWHLSLDMDPQDIHNLGLQEVKRIEKLMKNILKKRHYTGTIREFFDNLSNNPSFILNSSAAVLARYKDIIYNRIGPKLPTLFRDIPAKPVRVVPMPNDGPGGSYQFGSPDGSRQGVFYANLFRLKDKVVPMPNDGPGGSYQFGSPDGTRQGVFYANLFRLKDKVVPMPNDGPGGNYQFGSPDGTRQGVFYANLFRLKDKVVPMPNDGPGGSYQFGSPDGTRQGVFYANLFRFKDKVVPMPNDGPGGSYQFGSPDGTRQGVFYANLFRLKDNPTYSMVSLSLHEADPGHHMQDIYSQSAEGLPEFRKVVDDSKYFSPPLHFPIYTAYIEGWALYSESIGEADYLDVYQDDFELMGRYSDEIFRACRLVVDTGLHYFNWTREQAINYIMKYTTMSREATSTEINRYLTWPGQACAYKIGELKIKELRKHSKTILGSHFDIKDFHSVILKSGAVPLNVLENLVMDWVQEKRNAVGEDTVEKIAQDFYEWKESDNPEFASSYGYKYNDKLTSYKYERFEEQKVKVEDYLHRLSAIKKTDLSKETKISYDILQDMLTTFLDGYQWRNYQPLNPFNFLDGIYTDFSSFASASPFDTQGDFVNYVRRLELLSDQFQEMMDLTRMAIANGNTNHNASLNRIPKMLEAITLKAVNDTDLYKPFIEHAQKLFGDGIDVKTIQTRMLKSLEKFKSKLLEVSAFITQEYMPKSRKGLGVGSLPNGTLNYKACLKWHTSLDTTPEEVHRIGLEEVARIEHRIRESMANLSYNSSWSISELYQHMVADEKFLIQTPSMANLSYNSSWSISELYQHMVSDEKFLIQTPEKTISTFKTIIFDRTQPKLKDYFKNIPNLPIEVRPTVADGIGGMYMPVSADGSKPGIFYANVHRREDNPTFTMISLSLHEAIPGHHLAESYAALSDIPIFRKRMQWSSYNVPYFFPFYNAYVEGWALYSEFLGEEMGIYQDHNELIGHFSDEMWRACRLASSRAKVEPPTLGRFSDEMWRACRLVVDTGIHYFNWAREDAIDYMMNHTAMTYETAAIEVDRYTTWPGQACGYKMGEIKIKELRKKAENILGDKFDIKDFHYTILESGPMPLSILERVVDDWIESAKNVKLNRVEFPAGCVDDVSKSPVVVSCYWVTYLIAVILVHSV